MIIFIKNYIIIINRIFIFYNVLFFELSRIYKNILLLNLNNTLKKDNS